MSTLRTLHFLYPLLAILFPCIFWWLAHFHHPVFNSKCHTSVERFPTPHSNPSYSAPQWVSQHSPRPVVSASPGSLLEMHIPRLRSRLTWPETESGAQPFVIQWAVPHPGELKHVRVWGPSLCPILWSIFPTAAIIQKLPDLFVHFLSISPYWDHRILMRVETSFALINAIHPEECAAHTGSVNTVWMNKCMLRWEAIRVGILQLDSLGWPPALPFANGVHNLLVFPKTVSSSVTRG